MVSITRDEVSKHNQKADGWFIINNDVYDVTKFYDDHPGGRDILLAHIGTDATADFEAVNHSKSAMKKLEELRIGSLPESEQRKFISMNEVSLKKSAQEAWMVINNKVYDVTPFLDNHPGGRDILLYNAGGDATVAFTENGHSDGAYEMMGRYYLGDVELSERKKFVSRKSQGSTHQGKASEKSQWKQGDEALFVRIQEQLQLFIAVAVFIMAAYFFLS